MPSYFGRNKSWNSHIPTMDRKPWYEQLKQELNVRQSKCGLHGDNHEYVLKFNPFKKYRNEPVKSFKQDNKFELNKDCKLITYPSRDMDKNKRVYVDIRTKKMCKRVDGVWQPNTVSRSNFYEDGACFATPIDAKCAVHQRPELLRGKQNKPLLVKAKQACTADTECQWVKLKNGVQDCMSKEAAERTWGRVMNPPPNMPKDIVRDNIEAWLYNWYKNNNPTRAPAVGSLVGQGNQCVATASAAATPKTGDDVADTGFLPSLPQSVVNMLMKNLAAQVATTNRGILVWASTGSGKTSYATGVMDAFWNAPPAPGYNTPRQIIYASSIDAIAANPDYKFHEAAYRLFPRFTTEPFLADTVDKTMQNIAAGFQARDVRFLSFAKLANRVEKTEAMKKQKGGKRVTKQKATKEEKKPKTLASDDYVNLDNAVLIIDEVHNLFRPLATQRERHEYLMKHLEDPLKHPNLKIVILSATPGDNTTDIMKLLNMIRDTRQPPITPPNPEDAQDVDRFKQSVRGLVSYFDMSGDLSKFPKLEDPGQPIKYPMSMTQFEKYLEKYKETLNTKVGQESTDYDKLAKLNKLNKFWATPRKYANMLYKMEKNMALTEFSSKLPALLDRIQDYPDEKHYVYSAFYENRGDGGQGILAIANQLEAMGYEKLTVKEAKSAKPDTMSQRKRFVLAITNEIGEDGSSSQGKNLGELIRVYNHAANKNGELVHVFLASQGFNEGIDLKAVRHIHIFEPLVTWASDIQTLGRARRYCSHADLDRDKGEWTVKVHRYMSDFPTTVTQSISQSQSQPSMDVAALEKELESLKGQKTAEAKARTAQLKLLITTAKKQNAANVDNVEKLVFEESKRRMRELLTIYDSLKSAAVDCRLLKEFHASTGQTIECI